MKPYVVRQGDYLASIADRFGFDADEVWNDPKNDELRAERPNPNILCPGDLLFIPDEPSPPQDLSVETENSYEADASMVTLELTGPPDQPYTIEGWEGWEEPPEPLRSDGAGKITLEVPTYVQQLCIHFTELDVVYPLMIGHLNPIDNALGAAARLDNLGLGRSPMEYLADSALGAAEDDEAQLAQATIRRFQRARQLAETGKPDKATCKALLERYTV